MHIQSLFCQLNLDMERDVQRFARTLNLVLFWTRAQENGSSLESKESRLVFLTFSCLILGQATSQEGLTASHAALAQISRFKCASVSFYDEIRYWSVAEKYI